MKLTRLLKRIRPVYWLNARIKAYTLKRRLRLLARYYDNLLKRRQIRYDEEHCLAVFRARHHHLRPNFVSKEAGSLNIFWVGANRPQDETGFLTSLQNLGSVVVYDNNPECSYGPLFESTGKNWLQIRTLNDSALIQQVGSANKLSPIDILIGQMWAHLYSAKALERVRGLGIPVVNIAMDDRLPIHWTWREGHRMGSIGLGEGLDMVLTTSPETCAWYAAENIPAIYWPLASDATYFSTSDQGQKDIDVLFVGNRYGIRSKIVETLTKRGLSITCYGCGWPNGPVTAVQNSCLSKRAKIILGVGTVGHCEDVYTLKLRDFDALMTGALYITHRNPDLLKIFIEGVHLECYNSIDELHKKITYFLGHPKERMLIGQNGKFLVGEKHTWNYRLIHTFRLLGLIK